ncbi:MAG: hypothetical protein WB014_11645 [Methanosarcina sp.]
MTGLRKRGAIRGLVPFPAPWKKETEHPEGNWRIEYYHYFNEPCQLRGIQAILRAPVKRHQYPVQKSIQRQ